MAGTTTSRTTAGPNPDVTVRPHRMRAAVVAMLAVAALVGGLPLAGTAHPAGATTHVTTHAATRATTRAAPGPTTTRPATTTTGPPPNIVFVLTDDLDFNSAGYLPLTRILVGQRGATFERHFVNVSLCCPSRATTLRGQYAHNTGVENNGDRGVNGGYRAFRANDLEGDTVATRLQDAGYRTALIGKYMNGYPDSSGTAYVPPGWDHWASAIAGNPYEEYGYTLNIDGTLKGYGSTPDDYGATVQLGLANRFIESSSAAAQPFFLYLALYAPHDPAVPAPGDRARYADSVAPRTPAFDQADVSGMPQHIRDLPRLTPERTAEIDTLYRNRLASLAGVDRTVAGLVDTLTRLGQLDNTYIVVTSDNGYHLGQHRLPAGKQTPYDSDTHVPLLVRGPGITPGTRVFSLTGNVDYLPTFLDMAGAGAPGYTDGRSFLPLVTDPSDRTRKRWRTGFLLEHWRERSTATAATSRPTTDEPPDPDQRAEADPSGATTTATTTSTNGIVRAITFDALNGIPDYVGVRTDHYIYVEYVNGERELYDTSTDPEQIRNLAGRPDTAALQRRLSARLERLAACSGSACRRADRGFGSSS